MFQPAIYKRGGSPRHQSQGGGQQQMMQAVAQMLQQGEDPGKVMQLLVQKGIPAQKAQQVIQGIMQQLQSQQQPEQQAPQEQQAEQPQEQMKEGGIHIKPSNEGKFTAYKRRTGKTTEEALHSQDPHVRKMANFAKNAAGWKKQEGGFAEDEPIFQQGGTSPDSIYDYLKSSGRGDAAGLNNNRRALAAKLGIKNYSGEGNQNLQMLHLLQAQDAKAPAATSAYSNAPTSSAAMAPHNNTTKTSNPTLNQFLSSLPNTTTDNSGRNYLDNSGNAHTQGYENTSWLDRQSNMDNAGKTPLNYRRGDNPITGLLDMGLTNMERTGASLARTFSGKAQGVGDYLNTAASILPIASEIPGIRGLGKQGSQKLIKAASKSPALKQAAEQLAESRVSVAMPGEISQPRMVPLQSRSSLISVSRPSAPNIAASIAPSEMNYLPRPQSGISVQLPGTNNPMNVIPLRRQQGGSAFPAGGAPMERTGTTEYDTVPSYLYYIKAMQENNNKGAEMALNHINTVRGPQTVTDLRFLGKDLQHSSLNDIAKRNTGNQTNPEMKKLYSMVNENPDILNHFDYSLPDNAQNTPIAANKKKGGRVLNMKKAGGWTSNPYV